MYALEFCKLTNSFENKINMLKIKINSDFYGKILFNHKSNQNPAPQTQKKTYIFYINK